MWMVLDSEGRLRPGQRVLHLAPEAALAPRLRALWGEGYEPADLQPERFDAVPGIRGLDLLDARALPSATYDLILHAHVMEHVPGNITAVLWHLHRALKPDGAQICCIPIMRGRHSAEELGPMLPAEALRRFGQADHVRMFGELDLARTLGMIFRLPEPYDLIARFGEERLIRHAIPRRAWRGWSAHSVVPLAKGDLLLAE